MAKKKKQKKALVGAFGFSDVTTPNIDTKTTDITESNIIDTHAGLSKKVTSVTTREPQQPDKNGRVRITTKVNPNLWEHFKKYAYTKRLSLPEAMDLVLAAYFNQRKTMKLYSKEDMGAYNAMRKFIKELNEEEGK